MQFACSAVFKIKCDFFQLEDSFVEDYCQSEAGESEPDAEEEEGTLPEEEDSEDKTGEDENPPRKKIRIASFAVAPNACILKTELPENPSAAVSVPGGPEVKLFSDSLDMSCLVRCKACKKIVTWDGFNRHVEKAHKSR